MVLPRRFFRSRQVLLFLFLLFTLLNVLFTEPSLSTPDPDFSFITSPDKIVQDVKETLEPQIATFVTLCLTGSAVYAIIKAITGK